MMDDTEGPAIPVLLRYTQVVEIVMDSFGARADKHSMSHCPQNASAGC